MKERSGERGKQKCTTEFWLACTERILLVCFVILPSWLQPSQWTTSVTKYFHGLSQQSIPSLQPQWARSQGEIFQVTTPWSLDQKLVIASQQLEWLGKAFVTSFSAKTKTSGQGRNFPLLEEARGSGSLRNRESKGRAHTKDWNGGKSVEFWQVIGYQMSQWFVAWVTMNLQIINRMRKNTRKASSEERCDKLGF